MSIKPTGAHPSTYQDIPEEGSENPSPEGKQLTVDNINSGHIRTFVWDPKWGSLKGECIKVLQKVLIETEPSLSKLKAHLLPKDQTEDQTEPSVSKELKNKPLLNLTQEDKNRINYPAASREVLSLK